MAIVLAGCNLSGAPEATPTVEIALATTTDMAVPFTVIRATRTPLPNRLPATPTALNFGGNAPATAVIPPTEVNLAGPLPNTRLLNDGRGLTTGQTMLAGEFQVEGYCGILNNQYGVQEDGQDWYCTFDGRRALTLRLDDFTDLCRRTYNNPDAFAVQLNGSEPAAYRWRCIEYTNRPTSTPVRVPELLQNGRGLSSGSVMNNGQFEVEAYCSSISASYGVEEDGSFWYCTENGQRIITLGRAEFDDICFRTYNTPGAFAEQLTNSDPPAYRWRCYTYNN